MERSGWLDGEERGWLLRWVSLVNGISYPFNCILNLNTSSVTENLLRLVYQYVPVTVQKMK